MKAFDVARAALVLDVTDGAEIVGDWRAAAAASEPVPAPVVAVLPPELVPPPIEPPVVLPEPVLLPVPVVWAKAPLTKPAEIAVAQRVRCTARIDWLPEQLPIVAERVITSDNIVGTEPCHLEYC